ncbi:hypothetical protein B0H17DRAFT_1132833 [Mycena rosella]|uniref:Uncharacterized protein n=1 Tax=Mycena rosella TaxID=1033263 RepID=A0AAD7DJ33_MYCRO|nr:hypothetical protein B0H17DRAFT_1132833 [Mycena rosella]
MFYMTSIPCDGRLGPGSDSSTRGGCPQRTWRVRIMSDGGAKQPRYGIRFQYTGRVSAAHVARRVHPGSCLMAGPGSPGTGSDSNARAGIGGAHGALCASRIMYDGGPGMQSHHTHRNFLFGMVHLPLSGGTCWVII